MFPKVMTPTSDLEGSYDTDPVVIYTPAVCPWSVPKIVNFPPDLNHILKLRPCTSSL